MWLFVEYRPAALFSLKVGVATSTGAKTLFLPTPFAIRTALLDVGLRIKGKDSAEILFENLKSLRIATSPPERVVVTNLFTKVQKPKRSDQRRSEEDLEEESESGGAMIKSIAFREYAHLDGSFMLAFEGDDFAVKLVQELAPRVNYFGKRGSFFQWVKDAYYEGELSAGYTRLDEGMEFDNGKMADKVPATFPLGVIQLMDDWGETLTFDKVNVYSGANVRIPKDRVRRQVVFPYRLARSSRGFSYYERIWMDT